MQVQISEVTVAKSAEGLNYQILLKEKDKGNLNRLTRSQNHAMLGQPGAISIILRQPGPITLDNTFPSRETGGKAYTSLVSHCRLKASIAHAAQSGTGDTNSSILLLNPVANRPILGFAPLGAQEIEHLP